MLDLNFKQSKIIYSEFSDAGVAPNEDDGVDMKISVSTRMPEKIEIGKDVVFKIKTEFGTKERFIYIVQEVLCRFIITSCDDESKLTDEFLQKHCLPIALNQSKKYFDSTTKIYGYPDIEFPNMEFEEPIKND